jgi:hypothetical protein
MAQDNIPLIFDDDHSDETHERWIKRKNRVWPTNADDVPDAWINEQCGQCRFYMPLQGLLSTDWGVCSNPESEFDGKVMFEHDGCEHYSGACEWVGTYIYMRSRDKGIE